MGCCGSSGPKDDGGKAEADLAGQTASKDEIERKESLKKEQSANNLNVVSLNSTGSNDRSRTKSQEEEERHARQLSYLDKHYREKRITERKEKEAKLAKLNSDRSERLEKQWSDREKTQHFTARELFSQMVEAYPYDTYKYEQYIKSFFIQEDDFGVTDEEEDEVEDVDEKIYLPPDGNNDVLDKEGLFACLKELLLPIPTKSELHKNLDKSQMAAKDVKMMEDEIDKQHSILWKFFVYTPEEQVATMRECDIQTYMTYQDFVTGLSGFVSATVDWTSKAHKLISDTLFQIMDHDRDGYLDSHDITALLLALHKMYGAVFDYQAPVVISREDVEERAIALLGMDWGVSKVDQPVQFLNKRQFAHLFAELGEKELKELDLEMILNENDNPSSPRSLR